MAGIINGKSVVFHHNKARPRTFLMTLQKLREFGWEILMHPPYISDLASTDYHLFHPVRNIIKIIQYIEMNFIF